jgi:hypothetical protein
MDRASLVVTAQWLRELRMASERSARVGGGGRRGAGGSDRPGERRFERS